MSTRALRSRFHRKAVCGVESEKGPEKALGTVGSWRTQGRGLWRDRDLESPGEKEEEARGGKGKTEVEKVREDRKF
jgi:hypothetical protein